MIPIPDHPNAADVFTHEQLRLLKSALQFARNELPEWFEALGSTEALILESAISKIEIGLTAHEIRNKAQ